MRLYVGNLPYDLSEDELRQSFATYGDVVSSVIITDKFTGRSRGFGFIEMQSDDQGRAAIEGLHGADLRGRTLTVNEARPRPEGGGGPRGGGGRPRGGDRREGGGGRGRFNRDRDNW